MNLLIKHVKRSGRGFRSFDHYRLRILLTRSTQAQDLSRHGRPYSPSLLCDSSGDLVPKPVPPTNTSLTVFTGSTRRTSRCTEVEVSGPAYWSTRLISWKLSNVDPQAQ